MKETEDNFKSFLSILLPRVVSPLFFIIIFINATIVVFMIVITIF